MKLRNLIPIIALVVVGLFISTFFKESSVNEEATWSELSPYQYATFSAG